MLVSHQESIHIIQNYCRRGNLRRIEVLSDLTLVAVKVRDNLLLIDKIAMTYALCTKPQSKYEET